MPRKPKTPSPLRTLREALGKTQVQFAQQIGLATTTLQKIELGERSLTDEVADSLVAGFGVLPSSIRSPKGRLRHQLENKDHQNLTDNIRDWQTRTELLERFVLDYVEDRLFPKIEVVFEAARRKKAASGPFRSPRGLAVALQLNRWIEDAIKSFDLRRTVDEVLQERAQSGKPVAWDSELILMMRDSGKVLLPVGGGKHEFEFVRPRRKQRKKNALHSENAVSVGAPSAAGGLSAVRSSST
jgi:transcriptional regulator with XRE-family HTH domain